MSMTEKQGGSDLRANTSRATPTGNGREYRLTGHKFFCSAPMGDLVLLTAQTDAGVTLFLAPRTLPDGARNSIRIQRLKDKLGNRSNASSEIEFDDAIAYRIGEDGHGVRAFVKHMTHYIRMDFAAGAAGMMRQAFNLSLHHTSHRNAFGGPVRDKPMMRNTLADLAIEAEAAMWLGLRVAQTADDAQSCEVEKNLNRILVPIAKYWNCRRVGAVTLEALECHGGMGYVEEQPIARLYREAPLNSVWEGTSAVMGLDVMRAMKTDGALDSLIREIAQAKGANRTFDKFLAPLEADLVAHTSDFEPQARRLMTRIAMAMQASLLIRHSTSEVADTFCVSRLGDAWAHEFGTLNVPDTVMKKIVDRAG
jgi:putative acyl-CoA dehydrogenase